MTKPEAVEYLSGQGKEVVLENGVVTLIERNRTADTYSEFERTLSDLRRMGYKASVGIKGMRE